jgi:ATP10 protein
MRHRLALALLLPIIATIPAFAQSVPTTTVDTLSGKKLSLPDAVRGHLSLFILGFSRNSSHPTSDWNKNLRAAFAADHNLQIYQVADIAGAPRLLRGIITSGMRKGVPPDQRDNFFVVTDDTAWKQWASYSAPDDAYIVLVNQSGQPIWKTHGPFNQTSLNELKKKIEAQ